MTRVLIDTSPDMRDAASGCGRRRAGRRGLHPFPCRPCHGIDDLRQMVFNQRQRLPVWADGPTQEALLSRFGYAFVSPPGSPYPPILRPAHHQRPRHHDGRRRPHRPSPRSAPITAAWTRLASASARWPICPMPWTSPKAGPCWKGLRLLDRRCPAPQTASDPCPSGADAGLDRPRGPRPRGDHQHAYRPRLRDVTELPGHITPAFDGMTLTYDNQP
jgi:phosphoribosyl 1,2-cyclic phosphate phosphodiesterase